MILDDVLSIRDGRLFLEGRAVDELADSFGTPLYAISETQLRRNLRRWTSAFADRWPEGPFRLLPAIKACPLLAVQEILRTEGTGVDTFGPGEFAITQHVGFDPELVSVNGQKDRWLVEAAVAAGARITVDHVDELQEIDDAARRLPTRARVRIRVRPNLLAWDRPTDLSAAELPAGIVMQIYKPGVPTEQLSSIQPGDYPSIDLAGLHMHCARNSAELAYWELAARAFVDVIGLVRDAWHGWTPLELDVGGGFASRRDPVGLELERVAARRRQQAVPTPEEYATTVTETLRDGCAAIGVPLAGVLLEAEPGRAIFTDSGLHLTRVVRVKRQRAPIEHVWLGTDTSEVLFRNGENARFGLVVANRAAEPATVTADVVGCSCEFDRMLADVRVPDVRPGDVLALLDTGAYQEPTASNYNALARPATVLVRDGEAEIVKRAETFDEVVARDVVPERLLARTVTPSS